MKIELIHNESNEIVGYKLIKEDTDPTDVVNIVRRLVFTGMDDELIEYFGRKSDDNNNTTELRFCTKRHHAYIQKQERLKHYGNL